MKRALVILLAAAVAAVVVPGPKAHIQAACGLPDGKPLWIDYSDGTVPFGLQLFGKSGITIATQGSGLPPLFRQTGAGTVYWEMRLGGTVGTTIQPADPAVIDERAEAMFERAADRSGCSTPLIALNELNGASTTTPWSTTNAQYRANVLELVRYLASKGARPFLLVNSEPYTGGEAAEWWRQVAQYADIVSEDYFIAPRIDRLGAIVGSRRVRFVFRQSILHFTEIGVPVSRLGIMLGFQSAPGAGGREGLRPASAWFDVVKLQTLAAKQVASGLGISTVWSWGWGTLSAAGADEDKQAAACVYLWARDQSLCDGPAAAGRDFDASLTRGQIDLPDGIHCTVGGTAIGAADIARLGALTGDPEVAFTALYERLVESRRANVSPERVLAAEQSVISLRFQGSRAAYVAALVSRHASVRIARGVLADELRRAEIAGLVRVPPATESQIQAFYSSYPQTLVRLVRVQPAPRWLGGRTTGFAISPVVPERLFTLARGQATTVLAADGSYSIRPLEDSLALSAVPLQVARPAIRAALAAFARADALEVWTEQHETAVMGQAVCRGDHLPQIGAVDLSSYLPFLSLNGS